MNADQEVSKEIIAKGKKLLLDAHTNQYYTKAVSINNPNFFKSLMTAIYRPGSTDGIIGNWNPSTESTFDILNKEIKSSNGSEPFKAFEGTKAFGKKLKEHMNHLFNTLGGIERKVYEYHEPLKVGKGVSIKDSKASAIFDLVGKTPSEMFFDTAKQKANTAKWMKTFKPLFGLTLAGTLLAQFFFGKKDPDIKA
jgi:WD40 repeat protein